MATPAYNFEPRDTKRVYTPSLDSDEDLPRLSNLDISDKSYRLFSFRKDGRSWAQSQCSEVVLPETEIKTRAKRVKKPKHTVDAQLEKMSIPRKNAIDDLLDDVKRRDPNGDQWDIVAIENDKPELTKRTGEVVSFSVILAKTPLARSSTKPVSQERRRSFISPTQEFAVPARRGSKSYNTQGPVLERSSRQSQSYKNSQAILEDDPFGNKSLFSADGKPLDPLGSNPYTKSGKLADAVLGEPFGAKQSKGLKEKPGKKANKPKDDGLIDLDALLGLSSSNQPDLLGDPLDDNHQHYDQGHHSDGYGNDSPIEIEIDDHNPNSRGRKRNDSGYASKTPKRSPPGNKSKSKSKSRGLSVNIPGQWPTPNLGSDPLDTPKYSARPVEIISHDKYNPRPSEARPRDKYAPRPVDVTSAGRRRHQPYHSSKISTETAPSARSYSDHSLIEAEYEEYSSSGTSEGISPHEHDLDPHHEQHPADWRSSYTQPDGRYTRATRDHRRGPPSPQHTRYEPDPVSYTSVTSPTRTSSTRRPRSERFISDGAIQPYVYNTPSSARPTIINQPSRFDPYGPIPQSATSLYNHESTLPYPSELERTRTRDAERYMSLTSDHDKDQEIERLQWERDMARRERDLARSEAEMHQEIARRASVSIGGGRERERRERMIGDVSSRDGRSDASGRSGRYTHEPRLSRRYTDAYHG